MKRLRSAAAPLALFLLALCLPVPSARAQGPGPRESVGFRTHVDLELLSPVSADYPQMARAAGIQGTVAVQIAVGDGGVVTSARALSGHPLLRETALDAVRAMRFAAPPRGQSVAGLVEVMFEIASDDDGDDAAEATDGDDDTPSDLDEAIAEAAANPTSADAQAELGEVYATYGRSEDAIAAYGAALAIRPDDERAILGLGDVYRAADRPDDGIVVYQNGLASAPNSTIVLERLAYALAGRSRNAEAVEAFERLTALAPESASGFVGLGWTLGRLERFEEAASAYSRAIALDPKRGRTYHMLGWAYIKLKRYEDAIGAFTPAIDLDPPYEDRRGLLRDLAQVYVTVERHAEAADIFEKLIAEWPDYADAHAGLGREYLATGRLDEAERALRKALKLDPENQPALYYLSGVQMRRRDTKAAEETGRRLVGIGEDVPQAHAGLAHILGFQGRHDEAIAEARRAVELAPKESDYRLVLAGEIASAGRLDDAEAAYREALALAPDDPIALNGLGYFLADHDRKLDEAVGLLERAVHAAPGNGSVADSLGWAYFKAGRLADAERLIAEASGLVTTSADIQEHLGDVRAALGRTAEAHAAWAHAAELAAATDDQIARLKTKLAPPAPKE